jgi:hypothetical protein
MGLVSVVLGASGCSKGIDDFDIVHPPVIRSLYHEPERKYTVDDSTTLLLPMGDGTIVLIPIPGTREVYDDEDFIVRLQGHEKEFDVYVGRDVFTTMKVGRTFDLRSIPYSLED